MRLPLASTVRSAAQEQAFAARPWREGRRGIAAVEFAFIVPIFFTVILGMIEFGRAMMVLELLTNAARNGARVGVVSGSDNAAVTNAIAEALTNSGISGYTTTVQVNGSSGNVNTASPGDSVAVQVSVPYANVSWLPKNTFLTNATLTGRIVMRHE